MNACIARYCKQICRRLESTHRMCTCLYNGFPMAGYEARAALSLNYTASPSGRQ